MSSSSTSTLNSSTSRPFLSTSVLRRRLPFVGAFCMLTLGFTNFYTPLSSSALKTGFVQSLLRYSMRINLTLLFVLLSVCWIASVVSDPNWVAGFQQRAAILSKWKGILVTPLFQALLCMSLFPTKKRVGFMIVFLISAFVYLMLYLCVSFYSCRWLCR